MPVVDRCGDREYIAQAKVVCEVDTSCAYREYEWEKAEKAGCGKTNQLLPVLTKKGMLTIQDC